MKFEKYNMSEIKEIKKIKKFARLGEGQIGWIEKNAPVCTPAGVILRPVAVAPCTSDVQTVWTQVKKNKKVMLGHESVGEIVETGALVRDFKVADLVIVPAITPDWNAPESQRGVGAHCYGRLLYGGRDPGNSCFSELYAVNNADGNLALLPENISPEEGCMLSDMAATGFTAVESAEIKFGDTVAIIGIGPVGLMAVAASALSGASYIYAVGSRTACVKAALNYGANKIFNYKNGDIAAQILTANKSKQVDKVIIAGGDLSAYADALRLVKFGGTVVNAAYLSNEVKDIRLPVQAFGGGIGNKKIIGTTTKGGRAWIESLVALVASKRLDVKPLITHRFNGLDKVTDALLLMRDKPDDLIKPVVSIKY